MMLWKRILWAGLALMGAVAVQAQVKWEGCADLSAAQFKMVPLIARSGAGAVAGTTAVDATLDEPVKLSVAKNGDVFVAERGGRIKIWKAQSGTVVVAGTLNVFSEGRLPHPSQGNNENGIHGIVLDPSFSTNKWVYIHYAPVTPSTIRISRFTMNGDVLDQTSEKILLDIPVQRNSCCHTGGGMEFDMNGNLYITVGNNTTNPQKGAPTAYINEANPDADDQGHAANTNDLRGKILKITPTADGKYSIPPGNLFVPGVEGTRPEIWAMGLRNPYSLTVDEYRNWVGWGDVGPDDNLTYSEEWNLFTGPGNAGWPYFVGPNKPWRELGLVASSPVNKSKNNTGLQNLPPAIPATVAGRQRCAISGPVYHYDGGNTSTKKMPPHLNKKWLITDWWDGYLDVVTMTEDGSSVESRTTLLPFQSLSGPLDLQVGHDGAIYIVEYGQVGGGLWFNSAANTAITRLEYTGACHPTTPVPATGIADHARLERGALLVSSINLGLGQDVRLFPGVKGFHLYDLQGKLVWEYRVVGSESGKVSVPNRLASSGILRVKYFN